MNAILVTDIFPPVNGIGIHRSLALCNHLAKRGWGVTVLTSRPMPWTKLDPELLSQVPPSAHILRARAPLLLESLGAAARLLGLSRSARPANSAQTNSERSSSLTMREPKTGAIGAWARRWLDWGSWWFQVPDPCTGWFPYAVCSGLRRQGRPRPDVIFSSAPVWTSHLVAGTLAGILRKPWVADFRDPWCGSGWRHFPYQSHRLLDEWLERWVIARANRITCAWQGVSDHLHRRHPDATNRITTVLNGFDPNQIDPVPPVTVDSSRCVLVHPGQLYGPRSPIPLLDGMKRLRDQFPAEAQRLCVAFIGNVIYNGVSLADMAREKGVADMVYTVPHTTHSRSIGYLKGAEVAILLGQGGEPKLAPVPAKVYEYIAVGKPVLALGAGSEALSILRRGGCHVWQTSGVDADDVSNTLRRVLHDIASSDTTLPNPTAGDEFSRQRTAERLAAVLEEVAVAGGFADKGDGR